VKILSINFTDITRIGGVNYSIKRVAEELVKRGHECCVMGINPGGLPDREAIDGIDVIRIKSASSRYLYGFSMSAAQFIVRHLNTHIKPDVVHIHDYRNLLTLELSCILRLKGLRFVFSPHYARHEHNTLAGRYLINCYRPLGIRSFIWTEKVIANSEYSKKILESDFGIFPEKIAVVPHGVDHVSAPKIKPARKYTERINLLYAGVLIEKKGVQHIIKAVAELKRMGNRVHLSIVGEGGYREELVRLISQLDLHDSVVFQAPLPRDELLRRLTEADICLLTSRSESYAIFVAEALAVGTPCIVSGTTALNEFLVEPGCVGIDYPPEPVALAELIIKIHENELKVGPLSSRIRSWRHVAEDYESIYKEVAGL
jgi:glycosyltransferase involved in cell wall biosynthesis